MGEVFELDGKYVIGYIQNKTTNNEVCGHYTNKAIDKVYCEIGERLKVVYTGGSFFTHEEVVDVSEDDYGFWIETTKKQWRFDRI